MNLQNEYQKYDLLQISDILRNFTIFTQFASKFCREIIYSSLFFSYRIVHKCDSKERKFAHAN